MRPWFTRLAFATVVAVAAVFGVGSPAMASKNIPWVYTTNNTGAAYFDADLDGYPGVEKLTVCDNVANGRGIIAYLRGYDGGGYTTYFARDPSSDGNCVSGSGNWFLEETEVNLEVCEYGDGMLENCRTVFGGIA